MSLLPPDAVLAAYGIERARCRPLSGGLINDTFVASDASGQPSLVIQRLHPIFAGEVNLDLEAVTDWLAERGAVTPRLVRTSDGKAWLEVDDRVWRAITYVSGVSHHRLSDPGLARAGGELVGRFHLHLADFDQPFAFSRSGVHDTAAHLDALARAARQSSSDDDAEWLSEARPLARTILEAAGDLPALGHQPERVCHGDLKISNLLFRDGASPPEGVCLIDLDTLCRQSIAYELGDAFRSWCNPSGEDTDSPVFDLQLFEAGIRGYATGAQGLLGPGEIASIPAGVETIALELAARFAKDVFEDRYFGWDSQRFASRRQHNLLRARGQLALALSVRAQRKRATDIVVSAFAAS